MDIDKDIQKIIDDYVGSIEEKEEELTSFKSVVDAVLLESQTKLDKETKDLEGQFEANQISEDEYLEKFKNSKALLVDETKKKLADLVESLV